jgi:hypothetical protein
MNKKRLFRTVIATTYDVEAESPEEAEEKAVELFEEDMHKAISSGDCLADWMEVNTEEIEEPKNKKIL